MDKQNKILAIVTILMCGIFLPLGLYYFPYGSEPIVPITSEDSFFPVDPLVLLVLNIIIIVIMSLFAILIIYDHIKNRHL